MPVGIIKLKLGKCLSARTAAAHRQLAEAARAANRCRIAACRAWEDRALAAGTPPADKKECREWVNRTLEGLYPAARAGAREFASGPASVCAQEVRDWLLSNVPYDHDGRARWRWQAVLANEISRPTFRARDIPVRGADADLEYTDSRCTFALPVWSKESGFACRRLRFRLEVGKLSAGHRKLLADVAAGRQKLRDSSLGERDGKWYLLLAYEVPTLRHVVDEGASITLLPADADCTRPFVAVLPDGRRWTLGDGLPLERERLRLEARRKGIQYRYRDGQGSGHGRGRAYAALRPQARSWTDMQRRFSWNLIADLMRLCVIHRVGAVLYREPTMPVRTVSWFAQRGMPFDWTQLAAKLQHRCNTRGVELTVSRLPMREYRPKAQEVTAAPVGAT